MFRAASATEVPRRKLLSGQGALGGFPTAASTGRPSPPASCSPRPRLSSISSAPPSAVTAAQQAGATPPLGAGGDADSDDSECAQVIAVLSERLAAIKREQLDPFLARFVQGLRVLPPEVTQAPGSAGVVAQLHFLAVRLGGVSGDQVVEACAETAEELHSIRLLGRVLPRLLQRQVRLFLFHLSALPRAQKLMQGQLRAAAAEATAPALYAAVHGAPQLSSWLPRSETAQLPYGSWPGLPTLPATEATLRRPRPPGSLVPAHTPPSTTGGGAALAAARRRSMPAGPAQLAVWQDAPGRPPCAESPPSLGPRCTLTVGIPGTTQVPPTRTPAAAGRHSQRLRAVRRSRSWPPPAPSARAAAHARCLAPVSPLGLCSPAPPLSLPRCHSSPTGLRSISPGRGELISPGTSSPPAAASMPAASPVAAGLPAPCGYAPIAPAARPTGSTGGLACLPGSPQSEHHCAAAAAPQRPPPARAPGAPVSSRISRPQQYIPPPLDTRPHAGWLTAASPRCPGATPRSMTASSSLGGCTPRSATHSPRTPLMTRVCSIWRRRSTAVLPAVPSNASAGQLDVGIMCRICETMVPQDELESHTDVCAERLTNLMVLDHVISRLRRACAAGDSGRWAFTPAQREALSVAADICLKTQQEVSAVRVAAAVRTLSEMHMESHVAGGGSPCVHRAASTPFPAAPPAPAAPTAAPDALVVELLGAARDSCAAVAHVLTIVGQEGREPVPLQRLRGAKAVSLEDFEVKGVIARGTFGRVFLVQKRVTRDQYALKVMSKHDVIKRKMTQKLLNERNIMAFSHNDLVVKLHYAFASTKYLYFAMEYLPGGDLFSLLERIESFPEPLARFYTAEVVLALEYLHSISIVHRDIKPDNILIVDTGHIKLADFGLSDVGVGFKVEGIVSMSDELFLSDLHTPKSLHRKKDKGGGTPDYVAPELLLGEESGKAADYWSLGVMLYEFLTGLPPFASEDGNAQTIFDNILRNEVSFEEWPASKDARDVVLQLLQFNPQRRLGCREPRGVDELKAHPFFSGTDWANLLKSPAPLRPDLARNNFSERAQVYPIDATDADFLREELTCSTPRSTRSDDSSPSCGAHGSALCHEFLRRPTDTAFDGLSLWSFHLAAPHLAVLAQEEARRLRLQREQKEAAGRGGSGGGTQQRSSPSVPLHTPPASGCAVPHVPQAASDSSPTQQSSAAPGTPAAHAEQPPRPAPGTPVTCSDPHGSPAAANPHSAPGAIEALPSPAAAQRSGGEE